ncbi:MAG: hypothetical protein J6Y89_01080, partial [Lachnospiraceae bacterium]|nr:hypothetical protein [Lachnospiraceae bacterium]
GEEFEYEEYDYYYTNDTEIYYDQMDIGEYYYAFNIDVIYGDYYLTDPITFYIDEDGEITFEFD